MQPQGKRPIPKFPPQGPMRQSPPSGESQWDWSKNQWEEPPQSPNDLLREIKLDELSEKYARDWMVMLFSPFGMREVLETEVLALMQHLHQPYESVMSMPISRRKRWMTELAERAEQKRRK